MNDKLNIVSTTNKAESGLPSRKDRKLETQAKFDRLWLIDPHQFNPLRNCLERERIERTTHLIKDQIDLSDKHAVDLGCGSGVLTRRIRDAGAKVQAVDISDNALKHLKECEMHDIDPVQELVPDTTLKDGYYDLVVATEIIAYLPPEEYRLFFSELARLVKKDGYVVCSTALDINTEGALERFGTLSETELYNIKWIFSYHLLYIKLKSFFEAPEIYAKASQDPDFRKKALQDRNNSLWFRFNSSTLMGKIWWLVQLATHPIAGFLKNSRWTLLRLEKICKFIWSDAGISHAIFIGQRRPFIKPTEAELQEQPIKHKRQVWE